MAHALHIMGPYVLCYVEIVIYYVGYMVNRKGLCENISPPDS